MHIRRMLKRAMMPGSRQGGFSLLEVLIAGMTLTLVTMPLVQLFGTSINISLKAGDLNQAEVCLRNYAEMVWSRPFYQPYNGRNVDMDDFYWESVTGTRKLANSWDTAEEVQIKGYDTTDYPQFRVTVRMVFLDDDMAESTLWSYWGPKGKDSSYINANTDDPRDIKNQPINMIKFEVKAYYQVDGAETADSFRSVTSIMTRSQAQANLGITSVEVTNPGLQGSTSNSAPHTVDNVPVKIVGYGFSESTGAEGMSAYLQMPGVSRPPITVRNLNTSQAKDGILTGFIDLTNADPTGGKPWGTRAEPGGWEVVVKKGTPSAVLYNGFVVEFPAPELDSDSSPDPFEAKGSVGDISIGVTGDPILAYSAASFPAYPRCNAAMQLVWRYQGDDPSTPDVVEVEGQENRGRIISDRYQADEVVGTNTSTVGGDDYGAGMDDISDRFSLRGRSDWGYTLDPVSGKYYQTYYVEVWNCKDYDKLGQKGDRGGSSADAAVPFYFRVEKAPFAVYQVFDADTYRDFSFKRNWGFNNRDDYNLTILGDGLDVVNQDTGIVAWIGKQGVTMPQRPPLGEDFDEDWYEDYSATGPFVKGTVESVSNTEIQAVFDLTGFPDVSLNAMCWLYVYNTETYEYDEILVGEASPGVWDYAYLVRDVPSVSTVTAGAGTPGWYYNYYDLKADLAGDGLMGTDRVFYQRSDGAGTRYEVGVDDGNMAKVFTSDSAMSVYLNLIGVDCSTAGIGYDIWADDPYEPQYGGVAPASAASFTVTYGNPILVNPGTHGVASPVTSNERYRYQSGLSRPWTSWTQHTEPSGRPSQLAYAQEAYTFLIWAYDSYVQFKLQGMGFMDEAGMVTRVGIEIAATPATMDCTAVIDRAQKKVELITGGTLNTGTNNTYGYFTLPYNSGGGNYDIYLRNYNGGVAFGSQTTAANRWEVVNR